MNRSITGCVRFCDGSLPCPEVCSVGSSYANRSVTGCVTAVTCLVPDMSGSTLRMRTGRLPDESRHLAATGPVPELAEAVHTLTISVSSRFPRFRHQPGHIRFPSPYLPRRTALDSFYNLWSSNFWSNHITSVGSPPLPRKENPKSRAPNCDGSR